MKSGSGAPYPATDNTNSSLISSVRPALALANLLLCYNFLTRTGHHSIHQPLKLVLMSPGSVWLMGWVGWGSKGDDRGGWAVIGNIVASSG